MHGGLFDRRESQEMSLTFIDNELNQNLAGDLGSISLANSPRETRPSLLVS